MEKLNKNPLQPVHPCCSALPAIFFCHYIDDFYSAMHSCTKKSASSSGDRQLKILLDGAKLVPPPASLVLLKTITWFPFERGKWSPGKHRVCFFIKLLHLTLKFTDQLLCPLSPCLHCFTVPHPMLAGISCRKVNIPALKMWFLSSKSSLQSQNSSLNSFFYPPPPYLPCGKDNNQKPSS